jgi:hypothetical protein
MRIHANRLKVLGLSAFALSLAAYGEQALADVMPVQNLTFTQFNSPSIPPKTLFTDANPVGWTGGTGLISIDAPGTATVPGAPAMRTPSTGLSLIRRPVEISFRRTAIRPSRLRSTRSSTV